MKGKYLITTDEWFIAPNGKQYKSAWGEVEIVSDAILGIKTNVRSSNWFAKLGSEKNHIIIAGCQIHYAVLCDRPNTQNVVEDLFHDGKHVFSERATRIFIFE
jgi:hypothetical protein